MIGNGLASPRELRLRAAAEEEQLNPRPAVPGVEAPPPKRGGRPSNAAIAEVRRKIRHYLEENPRADPIEAFRHCDWDWGLESFERHFLHVEHLLATECRATKPEPKSKRQGPPEEEVLLRSRIGSYHVVPAEDGQYDITLKVRASRNVAVQMNGTAWSLLYPAEG